MRSLTPLLILLTALLTGCALSPQQVGVTPDITLAQNAPNVRGSVSVNVIDERNSQVVGSRGGAYAKSSNLTLAPDFSDAIKVAAEKNLKQMGLEIDDQNPLITFNIYVDELNYRVPEGSYVTEVNLDAILRSEVQQGGKRFQGRYQAQSHHTVVKAPSEEKNEELINDVLNSALNRLFHDQALLKFLSAG